MILKMFNNFIFHYIIIKNRYMNNNNGLFGSIPKSIGNLIELRVL